MTTLEQSSGRDLGSRFSLLAVASEGAYYLDAPGSSEWPGVGGVTGPLYGQVYCRWAPVASIIGEVSEPR